MGLHCGFTMQELRPSVSASRSILMAVKLVWCTFGVLPMRSSCYNQIVIVLLITYLFGPNDLKIDHLGQVCTLCTYSFTTPGTVLVLINSRVKKCQTVTKKLEFTVKPDVLLMGTLQTSAGTLVFWLTVWVKQVATCVSKLLSSFGTLWQEGGVHIVYDKHDYRPNWTTRSPITNWS